MMLDALASALAFFAQDPTPITKAASTVDWGIVALIVVGIISAANWAQMASLRAKVDGMTEWVRKLETSPHNCPYIAMRTEHHQDIAAMKESVAELKEWRLEVDRSLLRGNHADGVK